MSILLFIWNKYSNKQLLLNNCFPDLLKLDLSLSSHLKIMLFVDNCSLKCKLRVNKRTISFFMVLFAIFNHKKFNLKYWMLVIVRWKKARLGLFEPRHEDPTDMAPWGFDLIQWIKTKNFNEIMSCRWPLFWNWW